MPSWEALRADSRAVGASAVLLVSWIPSQGIRLASIETLGIDPQAGSGAAGRPPLRLRLPGYNAVGEVLKSSLDVVPDGS